MVNFCSVDIFEPKLKQVNFQLRSKLPKSVAALPPLFFLFKGVQQIFSDQNFLFGDGNLPWVARSRHLSKIFFGPRRRRNNENREFKLWRSENVTEKLLRNGDYFAICSPCSHSHTVEKLRHKRTGRSSVKTNIENERITNREIERPRQRRQQERHKFAYLTIKKQQFCTLYTFHFWTFRRRSRSFPRCEMTCFEVVWMTWAHDDKSSIRTPEELVPI